MNVVSYLELLRLSYTGCNPRGMVLSRDKALSKKLMAYHRIPVPEFAVFRRGLAIKRPRRLKFPVIVKSLTQEASIGISQASVVEDDTKLRERVQFVHESVATDAIAERFIEGRELYVGVIGNERLQVFPVWEMEFSKMPEGVHRIATDRVKWSVKYQDKHGIKTSAAKKLPDGMAEMIQRLARRVYRTLEMSGFARMDLRMDEDGKAYVLEANANPQLAFGEDFRRVGRARGVSRTRTSSSGSSTSVSGGNPSGPGKPAPVYCSVKRTSAVAPAVTVTDCGDPMYRSCQIWSS